MPTADNSVVEAEDETFTVTLSAPSEGLPDGAIIRPTPLTATGTITNDDTQGISTSVSVLAILEGDAVGPYTVVLDSQPSGTVTVAVASADTAIATVAPASLTFDATDWNQPQTVTATGAFTAGDDSGDTTITHTASGGGYDGVTASFGVGLVEDASDRVPNFMGLTIADLVYDVADMTIVALTLPAEAASANGTSTYTLTPALPAGLTFDPSTRTITGTPTAATALTTYTYTVMDSDTNRMDSDADTLTFTILVMGDVTANTPGNQAYTMGRPITALTLPAGGGGAGALTYTLTGPASAALSTAVPGLAFDAATRVLTGTPTMAGETTLTYTATDTASSTDSVTFAVTVAPPVALTGTGPQTYTMGIAITSLTLPPVTGGAGALTLTLTGPNGMDLSELSAGLSYDETTCVLSGTPTAAGTTTLTYTATDINGSTASQSFTVTVAAAVAVAADAQTYTMDTAITPLTLTVTGGTNPLITTLTGPSGGPLPPGLTFSATTRALTGTPTEVGTTTLTLTATDAHGSTDTTPFDITVAVAVALTAPNDQTYSRTVAIADLTLPDGTGGTGALTYTLTDVTQLPAGLAYAPGTRVLSGTPTATGTVTLTYTAADTNGSTASDTFTVTVIEGLSLSTPDNQAYTINRPIPDLTLPEGAGGIVPRSYTLTGPSSGPLPAGLTFDATARTLTGTPTAMATTTLTYTATDSQTPTADTASATFTVTVAAAVALTAPTDQTYTMNTAIPALNLPAGTDGTAPLTYTLTGPSSGPLPPGLTFDATTLVLTGTPSTAAATILTYTVTDAHGSTASDTVTLTVAAQVALTAPTAQTYTMDTAITALTLPAGTGGTGALTYTLIGPGSAALSVAVPGLAFNATTRVLTGTPTTAATTTLTYTATGTNGSTNSVTFGITVATAVAVTAPDDQTYTMGNTITALTLPTATDGTGTPTYTLTGPGNTALPTGLTFNATARTLTGTPDTAAVTTLTYTATDTNGSTASATFDITVAASVALTAPTAQTYTQDATITSLTLPAGTDGTGTLTYTLTGPASAALSTAVPGLFFDATTRVLSGTPTTITTDAVTLTHTATDTNGSTASVTFDITVAARVALTAPTAQTYTMDAAITALTLPDATGGTGTGTGTGTITYTLTGPASAALSTAVPGLAFNAATRVLTGTPTTAAAATTLTYTATDTNGSTFSVTFDITVAASVLLTAPTAQTYTQGTAITPLTLPAGTGGTGTPTYTLTGPASAALSVAVPGLTFDATARTLTGTPTTAAATTLTYTATDTNGSTNSATFDITVAGTGASRFTALNEIILPEVARSLADSTASNIARRIEQGTNGTSPVAGLSLGGQDSLAAMLRTHGEAMSADNRDFKEMLPGSNFVMPLTIGGAEVDTDSAVFWGNGEYRNLSGESGTVDWDGVLSGFHFGIDAPLGENRLVGVAVSWLESELDYDGYNDGGTSPGEGDYDLDMISANPYIGGRIDDTDWWATVGYGQGDLRITAQDESGVSSGVTLLTVGGGGSQLFKSGVTTFRLKGEALQTVMKVGGNSRIDGLNVDAMRARVVIEVGQSREMADGVFEPTLEVGARFDAGDGETGGGAEVGGSVHYHNPATRVTADGRVRALLGHGGGYKEWGIQGSVAVYPGADGQGASFSVSPGYGDSGSGIQELWRKGLATGVEDANADDTDDTDGYAMKLDARFGYGFDFAMNDHDGVLTPYSEMTRGATDSYRVGVNWKTGSRFDLNLLSERRENSSGPAEHAVLLKGEVRF